MKPNIRVRKIGGCFVVGVVMGRCGLKVCDVLGKDEASLIANFHG
jgi:hypothetical protein